MVSLEDGSTLEAFFYEYLLDTDDLKTRKPTGKWTPIRQDED